MHVCMTILHIVGTIYIFPILAGYDYKITTSTLKFKPFIEIRSQQQCLEIEIIDDSLPEDREVLTLLLSTNNSKVDLISHEVVMYISTNNGKYNVCNDSVIDQIVVLNVYIIEGAFIDN